MSKAERVICKHKWKKIRKTDLKPAPGFRWGKMQKCTLCDALSMEMKQN